jgi:hypothetical protein
MPMQLVYSTTIKWSPASYMKIDGYDDARGKSSHHSPKSRQGTVANDVKIERIGMLHTTVSQPAEPVTTTHCPCNHIAIAHIGTSHTTVSQQAEQMRLVTGERAMRKDVRSCRKIARTELCDELQRLQLQSRIPNES